VLPQEKLQWGNTRNHIFFPAFVQPDVFLQHWQLDTALVVFPRMFAELPAAWLFTAAFITIMILMTLNTQV
jgi:hypothetical protein